MTEPSDYVLVPLREGAEFTLYRGRQNGNPLPVHISRRPRASGGWSTNTRWQPNLIPRGQPSLWRSLVTKDG